MSGSRRKPGPLGPFVEGYRAWLLERGYSTSVVVRSLGTLGHLGRWMERDALAVDQLSHERVSAFLAEYRRDHSRLPSSSVWPLIEYLRALGAVAPASPPTATPVEQLVDEYRDWLVFERGLAPSTVRGSARLARRFLAERVGPDDPHGVDGITAAEVNVFLLHECGRVSTGTAGCCTYWLRSLLRYLAVPGLADRVWRTRCRGSRAGARRRSHSSQPGLTSTGCSPHATATNQPALATTRPCCCSYGWDCARSRFRACSLTISTGAPGRSTSTARPIAATSCRCPAMSARPSSSISSIAVAGPASVTCS